MADVVLDDILMYAEINDKTNRERALAIIRDFQSMRARYLDQEVGLTSSHCNNLIKKSTDDLEALNSLLELEEKNQLIPKFRCLVRNVIIRKEVTKVTTISVKELSEELGISRQAVYKRINQLPKSSQPKIDGVYKLTAPIIDLIRVLKMCQPTSMTTK